MVDRLYTITAQLPVRGLVGNQLADMIEVHWSGPNNITGWVRIPRATADAAGVDRLIREQLDRQLGIAALGSE